MRKEHPAAAHKEFLSSMEEKLDNFGLFTTEITSLTPDILAILNERHLR
jgi:hypothetical protein